MHAVILSIGDELAFGQTVDTNSAHLAARLARLGIPTLYHQTLADDLPAITDAIGRAADTAQLVIITGGIGPTEDDMTRQALADAMGAKLVTDARALADLEAFFTKRGRPMAQRNRVQAQRPEPATMIPNPHGTAPGLRAQFGKAKATVYVTPGVPREMVAMFEDAIEPELGQFGGTRGAILTTKVNTFGSGESTVAEQLGELMARDRQPRVGTTVSDGYCSIRIRAEASDPDQARRDLEATAGEVERRLGPIVVGRDEQNLQEAVFRELKNAGQTLATAESCTGGLVGAMLTDVPGSSEVYAGGWVTYTNTLKNQLLGVREATLAEHGAVSEAVVLEMAHGAIERSGAGLAVAVSGVAGPGGGTEGKPVGLVWFALAQRDPGGAVTTQARFAHLPGDRQQVRDRAAKCALQMVRLALVEGSLDRLTWLRPPDASPPEQETTTPGAGLRGKAVFHE